ncbi:MAG: HlyD family efflux transporter periplasmic adaptor subunit [Acidobacteria bacterium]|nr:HlyD family efflux transporter periplasmic adaptor subunit [Acidobacteriota bacterium]
MAMDVKRDPVILKRKKQRQAMMAGVGVVVLIGISWVVMNLEPAAPTVDANAAWTGKVVRGPLVREVKGSGTLVPEDIRWITATTQGRVERIVLQAGSRVTPDSVILELSNPDLRQAVTAAELQWRSAEAALLNRKAQLSTERLQLETAVANAQSDVEQQELQYAADLELNKQGLFAALQLKQSEARVQRAKNGLALEQKRLALNRESEVSQIAPQEADVTRLRNAYDLQSRNLSDLRVRAGMHGVLQVVPVEVGQQVGGGTNIARVADPSRLKAEIRVSETQTRDVRVGQSAVVDTRNGIVKGVVARIDPAAQNGTVGVDVTLLGELPPGARPDLSVDGTIELERLDNVLKVQRPSFSQDNATISLYRVGADGMAVRTRVTLGRSSVAEVEVVEGLNEGDEVVLSDMSAFDAFDRVRIGRR